jgi:SOS response regulatory protein OraA/RecX
VRTGLVDDARYAENRARALVERGAGDALVRHDLHGSGLADDAVERALAELPSERERAERIVRQRGAGAKTARYLAAKGFSDDAVGAAVADVAGEALG